MEQCKNDIISQTAEELKKLFNEKEYVMKSRYLDNIINVCCKFPLFTSANTKYNTKLIAKQMIVNDIEWFGRAQMYVKCFPKHFMIEKMFKKYRIDYSACADKSVFFCDYGSGLGVTCEIGERDDSIPLLERPTRRYIDFPLDEFAEKLGLEQYCIKPNLLMRIRLDKYKCFEVIDLQKLQKINETAGAVVLEYDTEHFHKELLELDECADLFGDNPEDFKHIPVSTFRNLCPACASHLPPLAIDNKTAEITCFLSLDGNIITVYMIFGDASYDKEDWQIASKSLFEQINQSMQEKDT